VGAYHAPTFFKTNRMKVKIDLEKDLEITVTGIYYPACKGSYDTPPTAETFDISGIICDTPQSTMGLVMWANDTKYPLADIEEKVLAVIDSQRECLKDIH
jgi:hypothetical protein